MIELHKDGMVKFVDGASSLVDILVSQGWTSEESALEIQEEVEPKKRGRKPKE